MWGRLVIVRTMSGVSHHQSSRRDRLQSERHEKQIAIRTMQPERGEKWIRIRTMWDELLSERYENWIAIRTVLETDHHHSNRKDRLWSERCEEWTFHKAMWEAGHRQNDVRGEIRWERCEWRAAIRTMWGELRCLQRAVEKNWADSLYALFLVHFFGTLFRTFFGTFLRTFLLDAVIPVKNIYHWKYASKSRTNSSSYSNAFTTDADDDDHHHHRFDDQILFPKIREWGSQWGSTQKAGALRIIEWFGWKIRLRLKNTSKMIGHELRRREERFIQKTDDLKIFFGAKYA